MRKKRRRESRKEVEAIRDKAEENKIDEKMLKWRKWMEMCKGNEGDNFRLLE